MSLRGQVCTHVIATPSHNNVQVSAVTLGDFAEVGNRPLYINYAVKTDIDSDSHG
jgi:hypothetical protein